MRQLVIFCLILLHPAGGQVEPPDLNEPPPSPVPPPTLPSDPPTSKEIFCDELDRIAPSPGNTKICTCRSHLGKEDKHTIFDFSAADQQTMDEFFDGIKPCEKLYGTIIINGNNQLEIANFKNVSIWDAKNVPQGSLFIDIRNNPKLKTFLFNGKSFLPTTSKPITVYIYNNPQLTDTQIKYLMPKFMDSNFAGHIIQNPGKCFFQDPVDLRTRSIPDSEFLKMCQSIKGDFIMQGGKIENNLELDGEGGCLRLIDVDMNGIQLKFTSKTGKKMCSDPNFVSAIENNPNLCGEEFKILQQYFQPAENVTFKIDPLSCSKHCATQQDVLDQICTRITGSVDISSWFENSPFIGQSDTLQNAEDATLTIQGLSVTKIRLPLVYKIHTLILKDNPNLMELDLPQLAEMNELRIIDCPRLTAVENMAALSRRFGQKIIFVNSTIGCTTTNSTIIQNIADLRLCTQIRGPLKLADIDHHIGPKEFKNITKITECVTVENTQIKNLEFLHPVQQKILEPWCTVIVKNNPKLCPYDVDLGNNSVKVIGVYNAKCQKKCRVPYENCTSFDGDLEITGPTSLAKMQNLEKVFGSLVVKGAEITSLKFPKLESIESPTAPALHIYENPMLREIHFPELKEITVAGNSSATKAVEIAENDILSLDTINNALLKAGIQCRVDSPGTCHYAAMKIIKDDEATTQSTEEIKRQNREILAWVLFGLGTIGASLSAYLNVRQLMNLKTPEVEREKATVVDFAASPRNYTYRRPTEFPITNKMAQLLIPMMDGILAHHFIPLRYKFHHGIPTADKFVHEKMNFNHNVHLCCDEYPDKMAEFIQALEEKNPGSSNRSQSGKEKIQRQEDSGEFPDERLTIPQNRFPLLHIGRGFLPTLYRTMHGPCNSKIKRNRIFNIDILARPEIDLKNFVTSTLVNIHYYNDQGLKKSAAVELTELHVDYEFRDQLLKNSEHKWMEWIYRAVRQRDIIQTDCGEAYLMVYLIISTIDLLMGVYGRLEKKKLAEFPLAMYETYIEMYRGGDQSKLPISGKDAWLLWTNYMISFTGRAIKERPDLAKFDPATAAIAKNMAKSKLLHRKRGEIKGLCKKWRKDDEDQEGDEKKKDDETAVTDYGRIMVDGSGKEFTEEKREKMRMPGVGMKYQPVLTTVANEWQDGEFLAVYQKNEQKAEMVTSSMSAERPATPVLTPTKKTNI